MWRFLSLSLLVPLALLAPSAARAADDETIQGKKLSEWTEQLRGEQARTNQQTLLNGLGCAASHPAVWRRHQILNREAALLAVALFSPKKNRDVFPALLLALKDDPEEYIRRQAAYQLGRLGGKAFEENLKPDGGAVVNLETVRGGLEAGLRNDKSAKVREACARARGLIVEDAIGAVKVLVPALLDPHEGTQAAAAESLRQFGTSLSVRDSLPQLEAALKNPKTAPLARVQLAITIGVIGPDANVTLPVLTDILKNDKEPEDLRLSVVTALGKLQKRDSVADLKAVLVKDGSSVELRRACVAALDKFGGDAKPALPELMKCLSDKDKYLRTSAMHAIGSIGKYLGSDSKMVVAELLKLCDDPVFEVRRAAIETLGNLGPVTIGDDLEAVMKKLMEVSKDGQAQIKTAAADALKKLKPES